MNKQKLKKYLIGEFSLKRLIRSTILIYLILMVFAWLFSERLIFVPPESGYVDSEQIIKIQVTPKRTVSAIYLQAQEAEYTILYCHGNAEDIGQIKDVLDLFVRNGYSVFSFDYSGYGTSGGRPSEKKMYEEAQACFDYLVEQKQISPEKIILLGRSLGSAPAVYLASKNPAAGLILEGSFVSAFRVMTGIPLFPFDRCKNLARIKKIGCPVLFIHGTNDRVIPQWHSRKLFEAANEPKMSFWVEGAGHDDLLWTAGDKYWKTLSEFQTLINNQP